MNLQIAIQQGKVLGIFYLCKIICILKLHYVVLGKKFRFEMVNIYNVQKHSEMFIC